MPVMRSLSLRLSRLQRASLRKGAPVVNAAAGLSRRSLHRAVRVVTVVGSLGKTTTAGVVAAALGQSRRPSGFNAGARTALAVLQTPPWQRHAVIEVGIDGFGQMARHAAILRPDIVVFTSIASDHNTTFRTREATRDEKARIFDGLRPGGTAILNGDDPHLQALIGRLPCRTVRYGFADGCDVRIRSLETDWPHGSIVRLDVMGRPVEARTRLLGRAGALAVAAGLTTAAVEGVAMDRAVTAIGGVDPVWGRLQIVPLANGAWLLRDDFKATLETYVSALELLASLPRPRIAVCGEVEELQGSRGPQLRELGARLAAVADFVVFVGQRSSVQPIRSAATQHGLAADNFVYTGYDIHAARKAVEARLQPGAVVLLKARREQRFDRIALALAGHEVDCVLDRCPGPPIGCHACPRVRLRPRGAPAPARVA